MHTVLFGTTHQNDPLDVVDGAGFREGGEEVREHSAVYFPGVFFVVLGEVGGEEDVVSAYGLEVVGHFIRRGLQVDVVVNHVVRVVFLFAAGEGVDGGPLCAVLGELEDDLAAEDACKY
jgi:hypothetical protein